MLCGAAVSIAGPIGFVGLLVPRVCRRLVSANIASAPSSACVGALLLLADIIARTLFTPMVRDRCHDGVSWCACFCHYGDEDVRNPSDMNVGLRPLRVGKFSTLVRP
ncbi:iron chelate uptake ABC transporter family permease subunit [Escherichia coli]